MCDNCYQLIDRKDVNNEYMLEEDKWLAIHPIGKRGFLCFDCMWKLFVQTFNREPTTGDFTKCGCCVNRFLYDRFNFDKRLIKIKG